MEDADRVRAMADYMQALEYLQSDNITVDIHKALNLVVSSAEAGLPEAQCALGIIRRAGRFMEKDDGEALRWFRAAAEQGLADAQCNLGIIYASGEGAQKDPEAAAEWFGKAAGQGHPEAIYNLGVMHHTGLGVPKDVGRALRLYMSSAELGNACAIHALAVMSASGDGVPEDLHARTAKPHAFDVEIGWLQSTGLTTGYADGTFLPEQPVSRQAMAAFLYRYLTGDVAEFVGSLNQLAQLRRDNRKLLGCDRLANPTSGVQQFPVRRKLHGESREQTAHAVEFFDDTDALQQGHGDVVGIQFLGRHLLELCEGCAGLFRVDARRSRTASRPPGLQRRERGQRPQGSRQLARGRVAILLMVGEAALQNGAKDFGNGLCLGPLLKLAGHPIDSHILSRAVWKRRMPGDHLVQHGADGGDIRAAAQLAADAKHLLRGHEPGRTGALTFMVSTLLDPDGQAEVKNLGVAGTVQTDIAEREITMHDGFRPKVVHGVGHLGGPSDGGLKFHGFGMRRQGAAREYLRDQVNDLAGLGDHLDTTDDAGMLQAGQNCRLLAQHPHAILPGVRILRQHPRRLDRDGSVLAVHGRHPDRSESACGHGTTEQVTRRTLPEHGQAKAFGGFDVSKDCPGRFLNERGVECRVQVWIDNAQPVENGGHVVGHQTHATPVSTLLRQRVQQA